MIDTVLGTMNPKALQREADSEMKPLPFPSKASLERKQALKYFSYSRGVTCDQISQSTLSLEHL